MQKPARKGPPKRFPHHVATYVTDDVRAHITHERRRLEISDAEVLRRSLRQYFQLDNERENQ